MALENDYKWLVNGGGGKKWMSQKWISNETNKLKCNVTEAIGRIMKILQELWLLYQKLTIVTRFMPRESWIYSSHLLDLR